MPGPLKVLVLHGPNLNLLGTREPQIYGHMTLDDVNRQLHEVAEELGVEVDIYQSNHEGALLDKMQAGSGVVQGCLLNAGALTHTSAALHDCIKAMPYPVVEVHLSNVHAREDWRRHSYVGMAARASVAGFGWRSYTAALRALVEQLREE